VLRFDATAVEQDVLNRYKATGKGWQSRMNDVLRQGAPT